jgi:hypothetical protein
MKRIICIVTLLVGAPVKAGFWDDVTDGMVHVAAVAHSARIKEQVDRIHWQLGEVGYQLSRVSSQTAGYHYGHFQYLDGLIMRIQNAWIPFTYDYNRYYSLPINDLIYLSNTLGNMITDLTALRLSYMYDYRYDLDDITWALNNVYSTLVNRNLGCCGPIPLGWSCCTIRAIADDLAYAERILFRLR